MFSPRGIFKASIFGDAEPSSYWHKVMDTGPIAYWPLWETVGTVAHCLVNPAQHGTYSSDVSTWPPGTGIGDGATAPGFDGINDYINVLSAALIAAFDKDELSWMFWIKPTAAVNWSDANRTPFNLPTDANNFTKFSSFNNPNVQPRYKGGGVEDNVTIVEASPNWRQYALTVSKAADELKAYRDGAQEGATQGTLGNWAGALQFAWIGANDNVPTLPWVGWMAHVAVWDRALSLPEIATMHVV